MGGLRLAEWFKKNSNGQYIFYFINPFSLSFRKKLLMLLVFFFVRINFTNPKLGPFINKTLSIYKN